MHGLILAGGTGSRLVADGVATPKAFASVGGRPQIFALAERFAALGCTSVTCMLQRDAYDWFNTSTGNGAIPTELPEVELPARVIPCITPSSLHTLVLGVAALPPGDVFCSMVDSVMRSSDWQRVYDAALLALADGADAVLAITPHCADDSPLWVQCTAPPVTERLSRSSRSGARTLRITRIGGEESTPPWITGGVYAFGPSARERASDVVAAGHERMRVFLAHLIDVGADVRAVEVDRMVDIDHRRDLKAANDLASLR